MGSYRSLHVWQKAHELTLEVYHRTATYPPEERFELATQTRRAASSIPANLAEGCGRNSDRELARFCRISLGSANELEYHLLLATDLGYLPAHESEQLSSLVADIKRMLTGLVGTLSSGSAAAH